MALKVSIVQHENYMFVVIVMLVVYLKLVNHPNVNEITIQEGQDGPGSLI